MTTKFVKPGDVVTCVVTTTGGISSNDGVLIGSMFGVAQHDADFGEQLEVAVRGQWTLPKATGITPGQGEKAYWDASAGNVTTSAGGNTLIGVFCAKLVGAATLEEEYATGDTEADVLLLAQL